MNIKPATHPKMMKTLPIALSLTAAFALPAFAQDEDRPRRDRSARAATSDVAKGAPSVLAALDRNRDGKLDQHEIDMAVVALRRMDRNEDGTVSADEMVAPPSRAGGRPDGPPPGEGGDRPRRGGAPNFAELDEDGDGKISKEESPERMRERFDQMDQNSDGYLDKEEQERIANFIRERMRNAGGQGRDRDRRGDGGQGETEKPKRPAVEE